MNHFLSLFTILVLLPVVSVAAQETGQEETLQQEVDMTLPEQSVDHDMSVAPEVVDKAPIQPLGGEEDYEERLDLSRKMHEIWPIRTKIEGALDLVSEQIPKQERLKFKAGMRKVIKFKALEDASVDVMADIFTADELRAMIAFYGSKEGRSVSHKTSDYERALQPTLVKMMDKALLDVKLGAQ